MSDLNIPKASPRNIYRKKVALPIGLLAGKSGEAATVEEMDVAVAQGWAGQE